MDGGPGAEGAPAFRDLLEQRFGPVLVGDLGVKSAFRARKDVLGVGAADKDEVRGERPDACHREQVAASRFFGHCLEPSCRIRSQRSTCPSFSGVTKI